MSKGAKGIFEKEFNKIIIKINKALNRIRYILPYEYNYFDIKSCLERLYFFEYKELLDFKEYYDKKNLYLLKHNKKSRYFLPSIEIILKRKTSMKKLLKLEIKKEYQVNFKEEIVQKKYIELQKERELKNKSRYENLLKAQERVQKVEPEFLDKLLGLYFRKTTTQKEKMYLFSEIEKYFCKKTINFFRKIHDTEYNNQLRERAFKRLQEWGNYVRLRKGKFIVVKTKNKKRKKFIKEIYKFQISNIEKTPFELEKRIEESLDQKLKIYDYFISHSSKNFLFVQKLKDKLNSKGKSIYCDWISDNHYLKRTLVGEATKLVINKRLEQSKYLILIDTKEARNSIWVKYELNYFYNLKKKIYVWNISSKEIEELTELWFIDEHYLNLKLY
ncbi:toll/interleukin-1 receptor domain-containing protein [Fusobacterium hominis]|uniref:Toll/interleukin-1 receptor domain-containing protein n=1 Tax=Fusobacterium hominis TaxID=2764326 RepID=A0A7G9GYB6_9FUSO|nr:toll/interleukin-1 receptor domain-containing protein [Fusobacterium hominis]QNM15798.1 toll/interleukin-1 receptor domain-containing protein [Fusobacterium hominis]